MREDCFLFRFSVFDPAKALTSSQYDPTTLHITISANNNRRTAEQDHHRRNTPFRFRVTFRTFYETLLMRVILK